MKNSNININTTINFDNNDEAFLVHQIIKYSNQSIFLCGKAGTGKSTLIKYIIEDLEKKYVILAPTGIVAKNIGGQTIHSFLKCGTELFPSVSYATSKYTESKKNYIRQLDLIIIDEVSMVSSIIFDFLDRMLQSIMKNMKPFGGKQILIIGDCYQLPPITKKDTIKPLLERFKSKYFFDARGFKNNFLMIELKQCYRQKDEFFMNFLDDLKVGEISENQMNNFNDECCKCNTSIEYDTLTLTVANKTADNINDKKLSNIKNEKIEYNAIIKDSFDFNEYLVKEKLILKIGAKVMFIKNDFSLGYQNGSMGIVVGLDEKLVSVKLENEEKVIDVMRCEWEYQKYNYSIGEMETFGSVHQFPLVLGYAISIHKSQGMTLDKVHIDLSHQIFESGQLYVALSRCSSQNGISLSRKITGNDIIVDKLVVEFYKNLDSESQKQIKNRVIDEIMEFVI